MTHENHEHLFENMTKSLEPATFKSLKKLMVTNTFEVAMMQNKLLVRQCSNVYKTKSILERKSLENEIITFIFIVVQRSTPRNYINSSKVGSRVRVWRAKIFRSRRFWRRAEQMHVLQLAFSNRGTLESCEQ